MRLDTSLRDCAFCPDGCAPVLVVGAHAAICEQCVWQAIMMFQARRFNAMTARPNHFPDATKMVEPDDTDEEPGLFDRQIAEVLKRRAIGEKWRPPVRPEVAV